MDVSRGYIQASKWEEASKIRASHISESDLETALATVTRRRRIGLPQDVVNRLEADDQKMKVWLESPQESEKDESHLEPRQSGTEEWTKARGEAGPSSDS